MNEYSYPNQDVEFALRELANLDSICAAAELDDIDTDFAITVLDQANKLASEVLAPLNQTGDSLGVKVTEDGVQESEGFADAYDQFVAGGWPSLTGEDAYGGQELPNVLGTAINELWQASNLSFGLCPLLTEGAVRAIEHHGSSELKETYLPKMVSGEWSGTMDLTEADAGSDLAAVKTKATPKDDHYLISGQKIYITWGDHQMSSNIIHLVLARLPDAPAGVKGISLFVVPKFLLDESNNPAERNDVHCSSVEHKLGIHASPTCVMNYGDNGGAVGYLVGEPHKGLQYMFTMMNHARQAVGLQGLAISERSYQQAVAFAKERLQKTNKDGTRDAIITFPNVRRMLLQMKASIEAMRGLAYIAAAETDLAQSSTDESSRTQHEDRLALFTPIVKGWCTEVAQEVTYLGIQIHGGMGFVEETGSAQHYRDARILTIYEGTTGIQALDLVGRKLLANNGAHVSDLLDEIELTTKALESNETLKLNAKNLQLASASAREAAESIVENSQNDRDAAGSASVQFMMMLGYTCGGWVMAQSALKAQEMIEAGRGDKTFLESKILTAQFYIDHILPRTLGNLASIKAGSTSIMALSESQF